ncbi:unnamed protein product [Ectocarpus sp. 6 AP-2014]
MFRRRVRRALPAAGPIANCTTEEVKIPPEHVSQLSCTAQMPSGKNPSTIQCIPNWPSWSKSTPRQSTSEARGWLGLHPLSNSTVPSPQQHQTPSAGGSLRGGWRKMPREKTALKISIHQATNRYEQRLRQSSSYLVEEGDPLGKTSTAEPTPPPRPYKHSDNQRPPFEKGPTTNTRWL